MKKKTLLGFVIAIVALAVGVVIGTIAHQDDNSFNMNVEALSQDESGALQCHPINLWTGRLWYNTFVCLNDSPGHCAYPHSAMVSDGTQDCLYLN